MSSYRKTQVITIVALVIAIVTLGVGFAAFSTTLNISSSASVSPSSDNFFIGFYANKSQASNSTVTIFPSMSTDSTGSSINIIGGSKTLSGLKARFSKPGNVVVYDVVIKNDGEYDAYLNSVNMSQNATCVAEDEATDSLVQSACEGIKIAFMLDGYDENVSGNVNIPIAVGEYLNAQIIMRYREGSAYADGPFSVSFEPITLDFSTVEAEEPSDDLLSDNNEDDLDDPFKDAPDISFYVSGTKYTAKQGMTWLDYINSDMNDVFFISNSYVKISVNGFDSAYVYDSIINVMDSDLIIAGYSYDWA